MRSSNTVDLRKLNKSYDEGTKKRQVLRDLELEVTQGQMLVLLGRSGSGKSTLLNLLSGIDRPDSGQIMIDGTDISLLSEKERTLFRRTHIGFVFQAFNLISTLTAYENIVLPLRLQGKKDVVNEQLAMHFLEEVGLADRKDSYPDRLSGGEQQRVAIARALAHEPSFILADEPTGNLDYKTGSKILSMLANLVRKNGRTMIIATHDREMGQIADRVLELQEGQLQEHQAILES
jgi:putative ABC transport system ATP-binding protein